MEQRRQQASWIAGEGLKTRWAKEIDPLQVLPEYPRPQMVRERWMNLNGLWEYAIRPKEGDSGPEQVKDYDGSILVPYPLESALSGVNQPLQPDEWLWYRRTFVIPPAWSGQNVLLHFGAVDWKAEVWINQRKAGEHTGGYTPFSFNITSYLREGENEIVVRVWDPTERFGQERGKQTLQPKGLFYTAVSGIWQTVWLEPVPESYITSFRITPDLAARVLTVHIERNAGQRTREPQPSLVYYEAVALENGKEIATARSITGEEMQLKLSDVQLWSPDSPFLYELILRLVVDGSTVDSLQSYFAMRAFSVEKDQAGVPRLLLNGEPLFQQGVLDQGYWPDGLYTAPTDEALAYDVIMAKQLGFNMIRKHIKVEPARWYYHCDRLGMIVWQDMVNGGGGWNHLHHLILPNFVSALKVKDNKYKALGRSDPANRENYRKELKEMIDALYNVPCIGMWVPFNEAWGQFDASNIAKWLKAYDPSRPVDHASGWHDQGAGDVISKHIYFRKLRMPKHPDSRAVVISEYGGYSLMEPGHVWREGQGFGYKKCKTRADFEIAYFSLMQNQLRPLITKGLAAAVYTQLTDVETELNGLLTYDREVVKIDPDVVSQLHAALIEEE
ncbi:glycoside hydrolase family 2 protein [Paenibacillus rubinfantis]|uniref:glycoside hydrolase family 2 protein n=1 Tax=Paenibacillus rubinfantis TaxID=1720296 RepID=UPI00073E5BE0|nr:glycoside hydrolase family 2 [Paenibacillus rubinfantis]